MNNIDIKQFAATIDHTNLKPDAQIADIQVLCKEAAEYGFAAVCVNPWHVRLAAEALKNTGVAVAAVIGFPLGATTTAVKVFEAQEAVQNGAQEIDLVINVAALKSQDLHYVREEIKLVKAATKGVLLKVILELGLLDAEEKCLAARIAAAAGADMLKTSTGFFGGATLDDVQLLKETAPGVGIKASGGIRNAEVALQLLAVGATRLGTSSACQIMKELHEINKEEA